MIQSAEPRHPGMTVHLSLDYLRRARVNDWLEAHIELDKMGSRPRVGGCRLMDRGVCLMKATATFAVVVAPAG